MRKSLHTHARRHESGYVMVVVMVFVALSSTTLAAAYDRMHQLFVFEESNDRVPAASDGLQEAMGAGVARLQTGEPTVDANDKYFCDLKLRDSNGALVKYRLIYKKLADNEWWVRARPAGSAKPDCPATFTDNACPAPL